MNTFFGLIGILGMEKIHFFKELKKVTENE
jgi:hypothetical protein